VDGALELTPQGPFSLAAAAGFGFGPTEGRAPAWDGALRLAAACPLRSDAAYEDVQRLSGIGPFYAGLIVLRASGFADALAGLPEPKGAAFAARYCGLPEPLGADAFAELAGRWRPFRTWAAVLIRLAGARGTAIPSE
jgi:DNA-3-methyladenine glycosylase II